ncbi:F-box and WD domain-containing protein [Nannizzia gypsea CBS 118893]|uniref:F-box and WD domain-containing protein n=1 Tax=Arthroderma gypseum (strain ATCC MYA-4604 / CBS 118893) TaxID=535722 RepID=E5R356_ARTGP|nr:F-box and WD domain-containing protein [Nannizzia gypsea CBS 118893]EFQ97085.1 F-box and WD domain-containing protein [Nannizzia gypsea CBS 118893]
MQPECYRSTIATSEDHSRYSQPAAQHGNFSCQDCPASRPSGRDDGDSGHATGSVVLSPRPSDPRLDGHAADTGLETQLPAKPVSSPHRAGDDAAIATHRKSSEDLGLQAISIESFPNEVLTHILSHLQPSSLSSMSLVSRQFHGLVTTPHAWRIAFSRYFPGPALTEKNEGPQRGDDWEHRLLKRRAFCRLTALSSWRNEYILRTRLLHSIARGKPTSYQVTDQRKSTRSGSATATHAVVTYNSLLQFPISHIDGTFGSSLERKPPAFVHGASEEGIATQSDPTSKKSGAGKWGLLSESRMFNHFSESYPSETPWGLGSGNLVGNPNVMDVSQPHGMVYGEGCPQGRTYFLSTSEKRGRFLPRSVLDPHYELGIPSVNATHSGICATWIAKSSEILKSTNGLCGMITGTSSGVLTSYALGPHPSYDQRFERGQITARWALCPGVPIVAIKVDGKLSAKRLSQRRIWITVLNALGELFYLTNVPRGLDTYQKLEPEVLEKAAWLTGRTVSWEIVESSRRVPVHDPFNKLSSNATYSPRSSSDEMNLDRDQIIAETKDIEKFFAFKPLHFRTTYQGWDMRRKLEVDFAGDDGQGAGESLIVACCSASDDQAASVKRFTRVRSGENPTLDNIGSSSPAPEGETKTKASLFGQTGAEQALPSGNPVSSPIPSVYNGSSPLPTTVEWRASNMTFEGPKSTEITACALDMSTFARLTKFEDPLLGMYGNSEVSSLCSTPFSLSSNPLASSAEIPGQRGRYMAVGTSLGSVFVWDIRAAIPGNDMVNNIMPIRIIHTDSPQISSVALTALYLVHGGNDGLVQAWDHLASSTQPIRTLNSRFSSRARRRLEQVTTANQEVGHNFFAAGAICLDQDPTRLRGIVALGTQLRYWAYSSSAADQYKSNKRRIRYPHRGSNSSQETQRFSNSGRGALMDYIMNEKAELERQKVAKEKELAHLSGRFGTDLLGSDASEDDLLAYACLLSEESYTSDERNRRGSESSSVGSSSSETIASDETFSANPLTRQISTPTLDTVDEEMEPGLAEAIRRSLQDTDTSQSPNEGSVFTEEGITDIGSYSFSPSLSGTSSQDNVDDLELAIQLSLVEQQGQTDPQEEFPALGNTSGTPSKRRGRGKKRF